MKKLLPLFFLLILIGFCSLALCRERPAIPSRIEITETEVVLVSRESEEILVYNKDEFLQLLIAKRALPPGRQAHWASENTIEVDRQIKATVGGNNCRGVLIEDIYRKTICYPARDFDNIVN